MSFIFTGSEKLRHEKKLEITKKLVAKSKSAHRYLPSIIGLGMCWINFSSISTVLLQKIKTIRVVHVFILTSYNCRRKKKQNHFHLCFSSENVTGACHRRGSQKISVWAWGKVYSSYINCLDSHIFIKKEK